MNITLSNVTEIIEKVPNLKNFGSCELFGFDPDVQFAGV